MLNEEQKTKYLNLLMDYEKNPRWIEDFYKYKDSLMPQKLYRYRTANECNLKALKENYIWLSSPDKFNDIYDCILNVDSRLLLLYNSLNNHFYKDNPFSENEIKILLEAEQRIKLGTMNEEEFVMYLKSENNKQVNSKLVSSSAFISYEDVYKCLKQFNLTPEPITRKSINCNVACFSETNDNILMWAHYAKYNKGFCIEYNTNDLKELVKKIYPILYVNKPIFCPKLMNDCVDRKIDISIPQTVFSTTKYIEWQYEKEWRIFAGNQKLKLPSLPSCIYLGVNIKEYDERKLRKIADKLQIPAKKMRFIEGQYKLEPIDL